MNLTAHIERTTLLAQRATQEGSLDIRHLVIDPAEPFQANGLTIVVRRLADEQMHAGHSVTLFYLLKTPLEETNDITDVPMHCLLMTGPKVGGRFVRLDANVIEALTEEATQNTIFHIHHCRDPLLVSLTTELRRRGIPYAMTIHGRYSHVFDQDNNVVRVLPALYLRFIERRVLESARFVQAITSAEQEIVRRIAPRAVCELIFNVGYSSRIDGLPQAPTRKSPSPRFPLFGFCGRYAVEHKGLDLLLGGFAEYRRAGGKGTLELVGTGPARQLAAMADSLSVGRYCQIGGPQFGKEKKRVLQTWDFFVLPSRFDVLPTAGLEAAILGLPLIASKLTGFADHIGNSHSGFVIEDLSPHAVAKALFLAERVSADEWARMSRAAFNMAVSNGDWTAIAARLVDLYRRPTAIEALSG
jgi:glycosyltransferase involved in cell wall biosynthesis